MKNTFVKVLSFLMALTMIVGMFGAMTISAAEHTHTKGEQVGEPVPATCASIGYTFYKCAECGETYPDDIVPKSKEHTGLVDVEATEATCTYPAMTAGKECKDCGAKVIKGYEIVPVKDSKPVGHKFVGAHEGTYCIMTQYYVCAVCNLTWEDAKEIDENDKFLTALKNEYTDIDWYEYDAKHAAVEVKKQEHQWKYELVKASTTCEDGATKRTCEKCNLVEELILRAPHDGFSKDFAGCEEYEGKKCGICGARDPYNSKKRTSTSHAWQVVTTFNTDLQKLGYTSKNFSYEPTCTEEGQIMYYCPNCKSYAPDTVLAKNHTWGATAIRVDNDSDACMPGYTLYRQCTTCFVKEALNTVADRGHVWSEEVEPPTCTTEGWTTRTCLNPDCGEVDTYNYTEAAGHVWGDVVYEYVIGATDVPDLANKPHQFDIKATRYCIIPGCGAEDVNNAQIVVKKTDDGKCDFDTAVSVYPATCDDKGFYVQWCTVTDCGNYQYAKADGTKSDVKIEVDGYDNSRHSPSKLTTKNPSTPATCTKEGTQYLFCTKCQVDVNVPIKKLNHTFVQGGIYDDKNDGNLSTAADKDFTYKKPTCTKAGSTAGVLCTQCGTVKVAPKSLPIDPYYHVNKDGVVVTGQKLDGTEANCQNGGTTKTYYNCCNKTYTTYNTEKVIVGGDEKEVLKKTNPDNHVNKTVYKANKAKCGVEGNHLYYICNDCGALEIVESIKVGNDTLTCNCGTTHPTDKETLGKMPYIIPALDHTGDLVWQPGLYETCDEFGYTDYQAYVCTEETCTHVGEAGECEHSCGCEIGKTPIAPHGKNYVAKIYETEPTCTTYGFNILANDEVGKVVYDPKAYVEDCTACFTKSNLNPSIDPADIVYNYVPAVNHNFVKIYTYTDATDCTAPYFEANECTKCKEVYTLGYAASKHTDHRYDVIKHAFTVVNERFQYNGQWAKVAVNQYGRLYLVQTVTKAEEATPGCLYPSYTYQKCANSATCEKYITVEGTFKAPIAHYSEETGEKVEITWSCTGFEASLNMTCKLCGNKVTVGSTQHKAETLEKDATCTENGYKMLVCTDCGEFLDKNGQVADDFDVDEKGAPITENDSISEVYPALGHNPYDIGYYDEHDNFVVITSLDQMNLLDGKAERVTTGNVIANSIYAVNPSVDYVVEAKDATPYADGYIKYMCKNCQEIVTAVIPARNSLKLEATATGTIVNNGTVTVDVAVTANDFSFNSFAVNFVYDNTVLKFEGAVLTFEGFEAADSVTLIAKDNGNSAKVSVYVPNGVDGLAKNATISGDKAAFMTLTFTVLPTANVTYEANGDKTVVIDEKHSTITEVKEVNEKGKLVAKEYDAVELKVDAKALVLTNLADANNDNVIDAGDSVAIMTLMYNNENSLAADVNGDGVVNLADHVAVLEFSLSYKTMLDYLAMMGITVDDLVAEYELRFDLDGDKDVDDTDKAILATAFAAELKKVNVPYQYMAAFLMVNGATSFVTLVEQVAMDFATDGVVNNGFINPIIP